MKPLLAIVTGRPGAGKSTLARELAERLGLTFLSRDEIKEAMIKTLPGEDATSTQGGSASIQLGATDAFFDAIHLLVSKNVGLVAEAAFQHPIWSDRLRPIIGSADVRIVVCDVPFEVAMERAQRRAKDDPDRERSHPIQDIREEYEPPRLEVPTLIVDTTRLSNLDPILSFLT